MEIATQSSLRRFQVLRVLRDRFGPEVLSDFPVVSTYCCHHLQYHFCEIGRSTNRIECPEWMFNFVFKNLKVFEDSSIQLQAVLSANGLDIGRCHALSELARPLLRALRAQLWNNLQEIERKLAPTGYITLDMQLFSFICATEDSWCGVGR